MADGPFLRIFAPASPPPTEVQERIGKALASIGRLNHLIPAVYASTPEGAVAMLHEVERATLQATHDFSEARHLVEAGKPVLPEEARRG